jgi:hypothetical protein
MTKKKMTFWLFFQEVLMILEFFDNLSFIIIFNFIDFLV